MASSERDGLIRLSAALAARNPMRLREAMGVCSRQADERAVEEVLLQSYLFLGYPVALNAFALWREVSGEEAPSPVADDWVGWTERGAEVCQTVYGGQYEDLRRNIRALHPDMERWMVVEGYGKVLGRPGLELVTRELCIAALLAVLGAPKQLYSHLRGALNAGATLREAEEAMDAACEYMTEKDRELTWATWEGVKTRWIGSEEEK
jgi:4-carboxymuconolactone decarboxylase